MNRHSSGPGQKPFGCIGIKTARAPTPRTDLTGAAVFQPVATVLTRRVSRCQHLGVWETPLVSRVALGRSLGPPLEGPPRHYDARGA